VSKPRRIFLVVRRTWSEDGYPDGEERVPVRGFVDRTSAENHCRELESEFRTRHDVCPLYYNTWLTEQWEAFYEAATSLGMPALGGLYAWQWWARFKNRLSKEQRALLWEAVPGCEAFEVIETTLKE
jgi:hypothetical protein